MALAFPSRPGSDPYFHREGRCLFSYFSQLDCFILENIKQHQCFTRTEIQAFSLLISDKKPTVCNTDCEFFSRSFHLYADTRFVGCLESFSKESLLHPVQPAIPEHGFFMIVVIFWAVNHIFSPASTKITRFCQHSFFAALSIFQKEYSVLTVSVKTAWYNIQNLKYKG